MVHNIRKFCIVKKKTKKKPTSWLSFRFNRTQKGNVLQFSFLKAVEEGKIVQMHFILNDTN